MVATENENKFAEDRLLNSRRMVWSATLLLWIVILGVFRSQVALIVEAWSTLPSHAHGFVVLLVVAFLVWRKREAVARIPLAPSKPGIAALAVFGSVAFAGEVISAAVVAQFALVLMLLAAVWAVMGGRAFRILVGPLCFLLFAIPFGHDILPTLMDWTADATVFGLRVSGIPVLQENRFFIIPSGSWSVVEACSGIRYLLTSLFVGSIYAYLTYTRWQKRLLFVIWMLVLPILANWLRAYIIVMVAHHTNNQWGLGMSHLALGWVIFGVTTIGSFALGKRWQDPEIRLEKKPLGTAVHAGFTAVATVASMFIVIGWSQLAISVQNQPPRPIPVLDLSSALSGLDEVHPSVVQVVPQFVGATSTHEATYQFAEGEVALTIAYYRNQRQGSELVNVHNLIEPTHSWTWRSSNRWAALAKDIPDMRVETYARTDAQAVVATVYWVGGWTTTSDVFSKIYQAINLVTGRGDDGAMIVITASDRSGEEVSAARVKAFVLERLPRILKNLDTVQVEGGSMIVAHTPS